MTEELLARRYRALLAFYPRWYREQRGAELVGTLLDAARPGQARPTWREMRALVLEGLRVRAGTAGHRDVGATLADSLRVTVLLALVMWTVGAAVELNNALGVRGVAWWPAGGIVVTFGVVTFVLVALGRFGPAVPLMACGALAGAGLPTLLVLTTGVGSGSIVDHRLTVPSVVVLVGAAVLRRHPPRRPRAGAGTVVSAGALPLLYFAPGFILLNGPISPAAVFWFLHVAALALYLAALGYVAVDPCPALVAAALLVLVIAQTVALVGGFGEWPPGLGEYLAVLAGAAVVAVVAAGLGLRRQVAALPAKIEG